MYFFYSHFGVIHVAIRFGRLANCMCTSPPTGPQYILQDLVCVSLPYTSILTIIQQYIP